jgi:hypothetical protein
VKGIPTANNLEVIVKGTANNLEVIVKGIANNLEEGKHHT